MSSLDLTPPFLVRLLKRLLDKQPAPTYSYFQVNRRRGRGARPCAPTTDVVQILEFCCNLNNSTKSALNPRERFAVW